MVNYDISHHENHDNTDNHDKAYGTDTIWPCDYGNGVLEMSDVHVSREWMDLLINELMDRKMTIPVSSNIVSMLRIVL